MYVQVFRRGVPVGAATLRFPFRRLVALVPDPVLGRIAMGSLEPLPAFERVRRALAREAAADERAWAPVLAYARALLLAPPGGPGQAGSPPVVRARRRRRRHGAPASRFEARDDLGARLPAQVIVAVSPEAERAGRPPTVHLVFDEGWRPTPPDA